MTTDIGVSPHATKRRFSLSESIVSGFVALVDASLVVFSGSILLLFQVDTGTASLPINSMALLLTTYLVIHGFRVAGLYDFQRIVRPAEQSRLIVVTCAAVFVVLATIAHAFSFSEMFPLRWELLWLVSIIGLVQIGRHAVGSAITVSAKRGALTRRIAVYGAGDLGYSLVARLTAGDEPWNEVVGIFDDRRTRLGAGVRSNPVSGDLDALVRTARNLRADEIVVALPWSGGGERIDHVIQKLGVLPAKVSLTIGPSLAKYLNGNIDTHFGTPVTSVFERPIAGWRALLKRLFDLTVGGLALVLAAPLFLLIAVAIKLDSRGSIFFHQQRFGFNNELIRVYKFRTMYQEETDPHAERLVSSEDPRVTRVGSFLRRSSFDELPQLLNILIGDMSLVGPRPHATRAKAGNRLYQEVIEVYASRHRVKPGLTGWAQVNGWRGETDTAEKIIERVAHDLYYIRNWSLLLDIKILVKTVKVVLKAENAY